MLVAAICKEQAEWLETKRLSAVVPETVGAAAGGGGRGVDLGVIVVSVVDGALVLLLTTTSTPPAARPPVPGAEVEDVLQRFTQNLLPVDVLQGLHLRDVVAKHGLDGVAQDDDTGTMTSKRKG